MFIDTKIKNLYQLYDKFYDDTYYNDNTEKCDCIDKTNIPDKDNFFFVCNKCGQCNEYVNKIIPSYNDKQYYTCIKKREYKKLTYLKLKINNLFRNNKKCLPYEHIEILKKKENINIKTLIKYMKKNKLIKIYDPLKSLCKIKTIEPIYISSNMIDKLITEFLKKENIYRENGVSRINYNHTILKIFQEWECQKLYMCFDSIQDKKIIQKHDIRYNMIFN
jgi:hypothetical protein